MKNILFLLTTFAGLISACQPSGNKAVGQISPCFCEKNSLINQHTVSCDTTTLSNYAKLFWQYNCDRIWLTLENANGQQRVINEVPVELYPYTYRLGFHLIREFDKTILFRSGCPANGPCTFTLIDKNTGDNIKEFDQLIYFDTEDGKYNFDFIVYFSDNSDHLIVYYVDSEKILKIPFSEPLTLHPYPQIQFEEMSLNENILTLTYSSDDHMKKALHINLHDKKHNR